jgi:SAM-dependent methyltransferase
MERIRKPFQGVGNIILFNWHFYLLSIASLLLLILSYHFLDDRLNLYATILFFLISGTTFISLLVSFYVYDQSGLYKLKWLDTLQLDECNTIVNIHAGFDETSILLKGRYINSELVVFDFYNPVKHTEVSIKRARKAYSSFPGTIAISADRLPLKECSIDKIFVIFSAHEIRNEKERIHFFKELHRSLKPAGKIIVTEHLRDSLNFLAYNIGALHFYSRSTWLKTFDSAQLRIEKEIKITPFVTTFFLEKHGTSY